MEPVAALKSCPEQQASSQQDIVYTRACKAMHVVEVTHLLLVLDVTTKYTDTSKTALVVHALI